MSKRKTHTDYTQEHEAIEKRIDTLIKKRKALEARITGRAIALSKTHPDVIVGQSNRDKTADNFKYVTLKEYVQKLNYKVPYILALRFIKKVEEADANIMNVTQGDLFLSANPSNPDAIL